MRGAPRNCGGIFEGARLQEQLAESEQRIAAPDFWNDQVAAQQVMQQRRRLEGDLTLLTSLQRRADDISVLIEWANSGEDVTADLTRALDELQEEIEAAETRKMLGGEYDRANAIVTIHPGAGGTESQDWAAMLMRMYFKWSERRGLKREIMDFQPGDIQLLNNYTILHARGDFEDHDDPALKRHLLRIWLQVPTARALAPDFERRYGRFSPYPTRAEAMRRAGLAAPA